MDKICILGRDALPGSLALRGGESLRLTLVALPGVSCECVLTLDLNGPGCQVDLAGLYLCRGDENVRLQIRVLHHAGLCHSRQLFKGIVGGTARADFDGLIRVDPDAQKTEAYQEAHTILLSDQARISARPQLEIYADDVVCSHGATAGFLDPDEQFYMRSRGIPEAEARRLQMLSFLSPVLERLPEDLQKEITDAL